MSTTTKRPSRLTDLLPRPSLRAPARPAPDPVETVQPDVDPNPIQLCHGYWSGPDGAHTQHTPCPNPADWAGLSEHDHAKTTLRCSSHRAQIDLAVLENLMFCLTCYGHIRVMNWREL